MVGNPHMLLAGEPLYTLATPYFFCILKGRGLKPANKFEGLDMGLSMTEVSQLFSK
jgi:hypothetical protein